MRYQNNLAIPINTLLTMYDLPSEDPDNLAPSDGFHRMQHSLLKTTCRPKLSKFFIGSNMHFYYDVKNALRYKIPDWFLVPGVVASKTSADLCWSYVLWQEAIAPFIVVELLTPGVDGEELVESLDRDGVSKWGLYERVLRVPYYVVFDWLSGHLWMFCLQGGRYVELNLSGQGVWLEDLGLGLGMWQGSYDGVEGKWLRWYYDDGSWVMTDQERLLLIQQTERDRQRADLMATKLRELGLDVDEIL
jgi:Uma2 family endonuclease